jgi:hypothetical protein
MKRSARLVSLVFALAALAFPPSVGAEPPAAACNLGTVLAHTLVTNEEAHEAIPLCP